MKNFGHSLPIGNTDMEVSMSTKKIHVRPGQPVPISGQYHIPGGKEVTLVKGNRTADKESRPEIYRFATNEAQGSVPRRDYFVYMGRVSESRLTAP